MKTEFPKKVIVSVVDYARGVSVDMELPSTMCVEALAVGIQRHLSDKIPRLYSGYSCVELLHSEKKLEKWQTLADVGAWDGSIIEIKTKKVDSLSDTSGR